METYLDQPIKKKKKKMKTYLDQLKLNENMYVFTARVLLIELGAYS